QCGVGAAVARRPLDGARRGMDHWTVLSPDGRVLAVEEGQRRSKRGKDYVRGRSGCVEPAHRPGGEFTPHFGRGPCVRLAMAYFGLPLLVYSREANVWGRCSQNRAITIPGSSAVLLDGGIII